jgi:hypothetical protein
MKGGKKASSGSKSGSGKAMGQKSC